MPDRALTLIPVLISFFQDEHTRRGWFFNAPAKAAQRASIEGMIENACFGSRLRLTVVAVKGRSYFLPHFTDEEN